MIEHHQIFPTLLTQFDLEGKEILDMMANKVRDWSNKDGFKKGTLTNRNQTHKEPEFEPLVKAILFVAKDVCKQMAFESDDVIITQMWPSIQVPGGSHHEHSHGNQTFSGVFYLSQGSDIILHEPRPQVEIFRPRVKEINLLNMLTCNIPSQPGTGIIFPAWVRHSVPRTESERISIAFNLLVKGKYGHEDLNDLEI